VDSAVGSRPHLDPRGPGFPERGHGPVLVRRGTVTRKACMRSLPASAEEVLHPLEERAVLVGEVGDRERLRELLEELALLGGEALRDDDADEDVEIAAAPAAERRDALALEAQDRAGLGALGHGELRLPSVERRDLEGGAEGGLRDAHWHLAEEVRAVALEERVLRHPQDDVEVAGGPPKAPGSPSPPMRSWLPESTPGGILIWRVRSTGTRPSPPQVLHCSVTIRPVPRQWLQVRATVKKPCWNVTCPEPRQVGQVVGRVPGAAPLPAHVEQVSARGMRIWVSVPNAASSKETSRL